MDIKIRLERQKDYRAVEELTREAFWNLYVPGCKEHLLVHKIRECPAYIPALDYVAVKGGRIAGHIIYCRSIIVGDKNEVFDVITFGPVSVLPEFQKQGIGSMLIRHSLQTAARMRYPAVLIYGDPDYYCRFGFKSAKAYKISTSQGTFMKALMALELFPGVLRHVSGKFLEDDVYNINEQELAEFDKKFAHKEKRITESQKRFAEISAQFE